MSRSATHQVDTRYTQTDENVAGNDTNVLALCEYIQAGGLSGSRRTHQRGQSPRFHVTVNFVKKFQASAPFYCRGVRSYELAPFRVRTWHRVAQVFPRKRLFTVLNMVGVGRISFRFRFSFLLQSTRFWCLRGVYDDSLSTCRVLWYFELLMVNEL